MQLLDAQLFEQKARQANALVERRMDEHYHPFRPDFEFVVEQMRHEYLERFKILHAPELDGVLEC